ncbi:MAG: hypothetical protein HXS48_13475 [Theionarchaea archaeon]|nr:hypothetical protein [Theionarchaea archaeon]
MVIEMVSKEMEYILKNKEALEKDYSGKYIAVHQEEIVASGRTIHEVYSAVETQYWQSTGHLRPKRG